jgi:signal transduction histidine kinase
MGRLLASLRSRVFAATALVAVLPIVGALAFVTSRVASQAEDELRRGVEESSRLVAQYHRVRRETGRERARLVADMPRLKAAVATGDPPTVEDTARDYRDRVDADVLVVRDARGRTLASLGLRAVPDVGGGAEGGEAYVLDGDRLLETFDAPLLVGSTTPELLGQLTLGFALDDAVAARLRALTGSHVVIAHEGRVLASSLPRPIAPSVVSALRAPGVVHVDIDGDDWVGMTRSFGSAGEDPLALVLRSRAEAMKPLRTLRTALLVAALVAVAISLLLSWAVARTVTRPLAALTDGMKQVAATGDLTRKIGPGRPWDDEDARLVARTFNILTDSVARFQKEAALRDRLTALGRLSTVIAHEVRNPLMVIKGSLRTLRREAVSAEDRREATADIDAEVARLDRIVGDVLDFARPLKVDAAPTDLARLCRDAARSALEAGGAVPLAFALDPSLGTVVTDPERVRGVVANLVANARDGVRARHDESGGQGPPPVEVGGRRLGLDRVLLWVADRGVGIAATDLPHLFEPYFTTKRTGTGLGLAIARKVAEGLGGAIRVDSREGEGTRIEVELPDGARTAGTDLASPEGS